jgi:hypothetical protein
MSRLFGVIAMKVKLLIFWYKQIWSAGCTCDSHVIECRVWCGGYCIDGRDFDEKDRVSDVRLEMEFLTQ